MLLLDVGGGSTEFIWAVVENDISAKVSTWARFDLMEALPPDDPPTLQQLARSRQWVRDFLAAKVHPQLEPVLRREAAPDARTNSIQLVGTGGTSTILARMEAQLDTFEREQIEGMRLTLAQVRAHVEQLWGMPLAVRKNIVGLPKKRADVILPGVVIYEAVMEAFGFRELRISTRGLRFAALLESVNR